jgi:hypothetical protein
MTGSGIRVARPALWTVAVLAALLAQPETSHASA